MRRFAAALLLILPLALAAPRPAGAVVVVPQSYIFLGACADCTGTGVGVLELINYAPGTPITALDFFRFTYSSNLLSFAADFTQLFSISGNLANLPGQNSVSMFFDNVTITYLGGEIPGESVEFVSFTDGYWCVGQNACSADFGFTHDWVVPEPATLALLGAGLLGLGLTRRRRPG